MTYGNSSWVGRTGHERPLGEVAVADVAPAGPAHHLVLAGAVGREVVVVEVALLGLGADRVDALDVRGRAERGDRQGLGLTAGEQAGAMGARDEPDLDRDRADVGQAAAVDADALVEDELADGLLLDEAEQALADARLAASGLEQRWRVATGAVGADGVGDRRSRRVEIRPGRSLREPEQQVGGRLGVRQGAMALGQLDAEEARQVAELVRLGARDSPRGR